MNKDTATVESWSLNQKISPRKTVCVEVAGKNKKHGLQANKTQAGQIRDEPKIGLETNTTR